MKKLLIPILFLFPAYLLANVSSVSCGLKASYEMYRGEGLVERSEGSLVASPVDFRFFTNEAEFTARFTGGKSILNVRAVASSSEAKISLSGGSLPGGTGFRSEVSFAPHRGVQQEFSRGELSGFDYQFNNQRVTFTKAVLVCRPGVLWDQRPVLTE